MNRHELLRGIARAARAQGIVWQFDRRGASHEIWRCGKTLVPVPRHKEIGNTLARTIFAPTRA